MNEPLHFAWCWRAGQCVRVTLSPDRQLYAMEFNIGAETPLPVPCTPIEEFFRNRRPAPADVLLETHMAESVLPWEPPGEREEETLP